MDTKSIFDLFGISPDIKDMSLKDYLKDNEHISGEFNKLSDDDKKKVVESMNKIQDVFSNVFGTKSETWTVDDFAGSTVNVKSETYSSDNDVKVNNDDVFTEAEDDEIVETTLDDVNDSHNFDLDSDECKECDLFDECLDNAIDSDCNDDCENCKYAEYCLSNEDDCCDCDDSNDYTICDELLAELEESDTDDEELVDSIVEYVLAVLGEKKNKKYILHPAAGNVPPAAEVLIPTDVCTSAILENIHIVTLLRDVLKDMTGAYDVYINKSDDNIVVYIPLRKVHNK